MAARGTESVGCLVKAPIGRTEVDTGFRAYGALSSCSQSACTVVRTLCGLIWPPKSLWTAGVHASASIGPVALAMKPIAPFSLAINLPAARVCEVTVPGFTGGIGRLAGPPGLEP